MITDLSVSIVMSPGSNRDGLKNLISSWGVRCAAFASAAEFIGQQEQRRPGCVVIDHDSPEVDGFALQEALGPAHGALPQVILSGTATASDAVRYMKEGAVTVLENSCSAEDLRNAIEQAISRDIRWTELQQRLNQLQNCEQTLTERERMVCGMVVQGMPNKAIAGDLQVSLRTVEHERANVFRKFGVETAAELAAQVTELRVVTRLLTLCDRSGVKRSADADPMAIAC